ncbi:MAG: toprim domain-containing protein [Candidatus Paceibacterota bacterium]|jgi:recombination protein RecR
MDNTQKLIELFKEFPGIGPRQAKRFVYFLLNKNPAYVTDLAKLMTEVRSTVHSCDTCFRFFPRPLTPERSDGGRANTTHTTCSVCSDNTRDKKLLMLVSHDVDFENIEKTHFYNGYYFVLGGTVPILEKTPEKRIRQNDLVQTIERKTKEGLTEIIMALNYNPEGENTLSYLTQILKPVTEKNGIKISTLGRGLSTGTELEYSDSDTIKNALKNRQ